MKLLIFLLIVPLVKPQDNNVCKTFTDYLFPNVSPNCWYDPDVEADIYQIMKRRNIPMETYKVTTSDGYILTLFRMVQDGRHGLTKGIIVLEHPLTTTAAIWMNGDYSLGVMLYEEGYEVWLPNARGSFYSKDHLTLSVTDFDFWSYSFHEIGMYDFPAQMDFIKNKTGRSDIVFIGLSLSTTSAIVYASELPEHAKSSVKTFIFMAPSVYIDFTQINSPDMEKIKNLADTFSIGTVSLSYHLTKFITKQLCLNHPFKALCLYWFKGDIDNVDASLVPFAFNNYFTRLSLKIFYHYDQINKTNRFQYFDYGEEKNMALYKMRTPPLYSLHNIQVPMYLMYGGRDLAATPQSVEKFYNQLPGRAGLYGKHKIEDYSHLEFIFGKNYKTKIAVHILNFLKTM